MLDDTPRKLLRIIAQYRYHFQCMPNIKELRRLSGRKPAEIIKGFKVLASEHYITWDPAKPIQTATILETWERDTQYDVKPQAGSQSVSEGINNYWLYH